MKLAQVISISAITMLSSAGIAYADPIVGKWKTSEGVHLTISKCGSVFCVDVAKGKFKGKRAGKLSKKGKGYAGTLTQLSSGISFTGNASITGSVMKLAAKKFGVTVKRDTWTRR